MLTYHRHNLPTDINIISIDSLKSFLKVDTTEDDALIQALLSTARAYVEDYTGVMCNTGQVDYYGESFTDFRFTAGPVTSLTSVGYKTDATTYATLDTTNYAFSSKSIPQRLEFYTTPTPYDKTLERVKVITTTGYGETAVPKPLVQAMRLLIGHWYEQRTQVIVGTITAQIPQGIHALLNPYRIL